MTTTTRRRFSVAIAAAGTLPAASAVAAADPHRGWLAAIEACIAEIDAIYAARPTMQEQNAAKPLIDAIYDRQDELLDKLTGTQATTKDGILVQVEVVLRDSLVFVDLPVDEQLPLGDDQLRACMVNIQAALVGMA